MNPKIWRYLIVTLYLVSTDYLYKTLALSYKVELGNKELFDKEQIGIKEPFPVTNLPFTS